MPWYLGNGECRGMRRRARGAEEETVQLVLTRLSGVFLRVVHLFRGSVAFTHTEPAATHHTLHAHLNTNTSGEMTTLASSEKHLLSSFTYCNLLLSHSFIVLYF